jgi:hypothetical protein
MRVVVSTKIAALTRAITTAAFAPAYTTATVWLRRRRIYGYNKGGYSGTSHRVASASPQ